MDNQIISTEQQVRNTECCMCHKKPQRGVVLLNLMEEWYCGECYLKLKEKVKHKFQNEMKELREKI